MPKTPLHLQISSIIKESIEQGILQPNEHGVLPAQQELAENYKVGLGTIKRAVKDLESTGVVVSHRGKGLMLNSSNTLMPPVTENVTRMLQVGVAFFGVFSGIGNPVVSRLINGIESFTSTNNMALHVVSMPEWEINLQESTLFSSFPFMSLDGIILLSTISTHSLAKILESQIPCVLHGVASDLQAYCHSNDLTQTVYAVTDAVLRRGLKHPVFFAGNRNRIGYPSFMAGYKLALLHHGISVDEQYVSFEDYDSDAAVAFVENLVECGNPVDSIISFDDIMAAKLHDYMVSRGRKDVLIAGFGNIDEFKDKVAITADLRLQEIGVNIATTLHDIINGNKPAQTKHYYESIIIER